MAAERKPRQLSDGMVSILRAMAEGKPVHSVWSTGRSYQGGLTTAMHALYKRGLITRDYKLTDAGRAAAGVPGTPAAEPPREPWPFPSESNGVLEGRRQRAAAEKRADGVPPCGEGQQEPIPDRVYWAPLADNFYSADGQGMGLEFHRKWKPRRAEFPQGESFGFGKGSAHNPFKDPPRNAGVKGLGDAQ